MNIKEFKNRCKKWNYKSWTKGSLEKYWEGGGLTIEQIFYNREMISDRNFSIAILGSVGKTSLLQILKFLIQQVGYSCYATRINDNWLPQLPFATHLACKKKADYSLFECGVAACGDAEMMAAIVPADIIIYTQFADVNIGILGSREGVANEKLSFRKSYPNATIISHIENKPFFENSQDIIFYGEKLSEAQFQYSIKKVMKEKMIIKINYSQKLSTFFINDIGYHLGAACAGASAAMNIIKKQSLPKNIQLGMYKNPQQRMQSYIYKGVHFIIDTANANEQSILNALNTLLGISSKLQKHAIVGEIAGLGSATIPIMDRLMEKVYKLDINQLMSLRLVGNYFIERKKEIEKNLDTHIIFYRNMDELQKYFSPKEFKNQIVLLRSSTQQGKNFSNLLENYNGKSDETSPEYM